MKKIAILLGSLLGLIILAALIVPFVVDVDKYRPAIVSKVNEKLNGNLELGKLALSLWGRVNIKVDGLKLTDAHGIHVVDVKDASFNLPLMSLLTGHPEVRIQLTEPLINVIKQRDGKLNVMGLVKQETAQPAVSQTTNAAKPNAPTSQGEGVPAIVMNSRVTVLIDRAKLAYKDELTGAKYDLNDFNFRLEDVSPSSNMPFEASANLDVKQGATTVVGPLVLDGNIKATSDNGAFEKADAKAALKLDDLEITQPGVFHKKKGVALGADAEATVNKDSFSAPKIKFHLANVVIDGEASGKTANGVTTINFKAHSNQVDVAKLAELSPLVTQYGMNGLLEVNINASGPTDKLTYGADLKFNKISLVNEALKQPVEVNGSLAVVTNELRDLSVKLAAKGFDLNIDGSLQNFSAPKFKFKIVSDQMNLDGLLKSSEKAAVARKQAASGQPAAAGGGEGVSPNAPVVDYNAMFEPLRKNPTAAAASGTIDFNLKAIKSTGVVISDMQGQLALNNLLLALRNFQMHIFDGSVKGSMGFNVKPVKPEVSTNITLAGLQTQKMVENSMPIARNSIRGVISAVLNIGGSGLNQSDIIRDWKGNGTFDIKNAFFSTLDIGRQIRDGVIAKLPEFVRSKIKVPDALVERSGEYEVVGVKFALINGVLTANDIYGKAIPHKGLDLKGSGTVHLADYALDMNVDIIDTYNLLNADEVAKDSRYGHFALSARLGGTLFSPNFDWGASIGRLAQNAAKQQLQGRAQEALKKQLGGNQAAGNLLNKVLGVGGSGGGNNPQQQQQPTPNPQDAVNKALKGLFGH